MHVVKAVTWTSLSSIVDRVTCDRLPMVTSPDFDTFVVKRCFDDSYRWSCSHVPFFDTSEELNPHGNLSLYRIFMFNNMPDPRKQTNVKVLLFPRVMPDCRENQAYFLVMKPQDTLCRLKDYLFEWFYKSATNLGLISDDW